MSYNPTKMKKLLELDHFLLETFKELQHGIDDENAALEMIFESYVMRDPIIKNAYLHLT